MKAKSVISFVLIMILIAAFAVVCVGDINIGNFRVPSVLDRDKGIKQGLDLVGGSIIVFEPKDVELSKVTPAQMDSAEAVLRARLDSMGQNEATISRQGATSIRVEIPDMDDPQQAVDLIGQVAKLEFRYMYTDTAEDGSTGYDLAMEGSSDYVKNASMEFGPVNQGGNSEYYVSLELTAKGQEAFKEATSNAVAQSYNGKAIANQIVIALDEDIVSAPSVDEVIDSTTCIIHGSFDAESANNLASVINSGSLPFALQDAELRSVGPTLGSQALDTSLKAALIGIILVMLFMLLFYRLPGLVADISLVAYISITLLIMAGFFIGDGVTSGYRITLTLPGIAGVILSIGMAVDANVVIFERIKDELRQGKSVGASVDGGYKRAITAVIDSNVTTIIACVVLYIFGSGTIKSFAITLGIGILVSMFSAIFLTKWLLKLIVGFGVRSNWLYGVNKRRDA